MKAIFINKKTNSYCIKDNNNKTMGLYNIDGNIFIPKKTMYSPAELQLISREVEGLSYRHNNDSSYHNFDDDY